MTPKGWRELIKKRADQKEAEERRVKQQAIIEFEKAYETFFDNYGHVLTKMIEEASSFPIVYKIGSRLQTPHDKKTEAELIATWFLRHGWFVGQTEEIVATNFYSRRKEVTVYVYPSKLSALFDLCKCELIFIPIVMATVFTLGLFLPIFYIFWFKSRGRPAINTFREL